MKPNRFFGVALIFCIFFLTSVQSHAQRYSPEFQALLNQIQQNYLAPKGEDLSVLESRFPEVAAALIGHALRQQMVHVQQNPSLNNRFNNLQQEARTYITNVSQTTSARLKDGNRYPPDGLWYIVDRVFQGQEEDWILQNFRVKTGTIPSVLAVSRGPQPPGHSTASPAFDKEEKNQIELFGIGAPSVKGPSKATPPPPPPTKQVTLNPDGIVGNWSGNNHKTQLKIWKQGDSYLGMTSGKQGAYWYAFKPNVISIRLKYAGPGEKGPIFKGQSLEQRGAQMIDRWEDTTFYYYLSFGKEVFSQSPQPLDSGDFRRP